MLKTLFTMQEVDCHNGKLGDKTTAGSIERWAAELGVERAMPCPRCRDFGSGFKAPGLIFHRTTC